MTIPNKKEILTRKEMNVFIKSYREIKGQGDQGSQFFCFFLEYGKTILAKALPHVEQSRFLEPYCDHSL